MRQKIISIKGCKTCKEVLIYVHRDDDGKDYIAIQAWHETKDGSLFQKETIDGFSCPLLLERIIADFSEFSANVFACSFIV